RAQGVSVVRPKSGGSKSTTFRHTKPWEEPRMVRASTLLQLTARLIGVVSVAALLSAATFQAAWAQTAPNLLTAGSFAVLGASTVTNSGATFVTGDLGSCPGHAATSFCT